MIYRIIHGVAKNSVSLFRLALVAFFCFVANGVGHAQLMRAVVSNDSAMALIDDKGKFVTPFSFLSIDSFRFGMARVTIEKTFLTGLIDVNGNWILKPIYENVEALSETLIITSRIVNKDEVYELVNRDGSKSLFVQNADYPVNSYNTVYYNNKLYVDNRSYNTAIFTMAGEKLNEFPGTIKSPGFVNGVAVVSISPYVEAPICYLIDENGKSLSSPKAEIDIHPKISDRVYRYYGFVSDSSFLFDSPYLRYGFLFSNGKTLTPLKFEHVGEFSEKLGYAIDRDSVCGYINHRGVWQIKFPKPTYGSKFSQGLALIHPYSVAGKGYQVIRPNGSVSFSLPYGAALYYREGLCVVNNGGFEQIISHGYWGDMRDVIEDGKSGYVDMTGKLVIPLHFDGARSFVNGFAAVKITDKWGFIDKKGDLVIPANYFMVTDMQVVD